MRGLSTYLASISSSEDFHVRLKAAGLEAFAENEDIATSQPNERVVMSISTVRRLSRTLKESSSDMHICDLLIGCRIDFTPPQELPRNPILDSRLEALRNRAKNKEYVNMTKNVDPTYQASHVNEFRSDMQGVRSQLVAVFNLVITVFACFLFGYKATEYTLPSPHLPSQVIAGIMVAAVGAIADLYFLVRQVDATAPS